MTALYPAFLKLDGLPVVVVGGGPVAAGKLDGLLAAGARVTVIAPSVLPEIRERVTVIEAAFRPEHLAGARWVVAAATPAVNREVAAAAEARGLFVNAVDHPEVATAYLGGVVRRGPIEIAISTGGLAPALAGLLREALDALLPRDLERWAQVATAARAEWKRAGVPMAERRPLLLRALDRLYEGGCMIGLVSLVGAGPGDPDLLTVRALRRLREADLVLYDALIEIDERLVELAPTARRFYVGKRAGRHSIDQDGIHRLMIRAAHRGQRVVRLKCGDPFVFGRGGEEALALEAAGVPYEVVPGVSSAIAAPALAGIPVTHRGLASGFAVISGHAEAAFGPMVEAIAPGALTLVVLMGLRTRAELAARLIARGWSESTPAAIVLGASHVEEGRWVGTLATLASAAIELEQPGVIVVGEVVRLARQLERESLAEVL